MEDFLDPICNILVIGAGGGGNNAVARMVEDNVLGCKFYAVNTDKQVLNKIKSDKIQVLQIGEKLTRGLGTGSNPEIGQKAAQESREQIEAILKDVDLVFITAGMGGGTGTGSSPVIASIAKQLGILTIGVVTRPFEFEGAHRTLNADIGINNLAKFVDATIVVPNQKLIESAPENTGLKDSFKIADEVLRQGVQGLIDLIVTTMDINLDFADVASVIRNAGIAHMGVGRAKGEGRLLQAIRRAVSSPLLETSINGATKIIMSVKGGKDLALHEVANCGNLVRTVVDPGCNIIFGAHIDDNFEDEVQVMVIATGFPQYHKQSQHQHQAVTSADVVAAFEQKQMTSSGEMREAQSEQSLGGESHALQPPFNQSGQVNPIQNMTQNLGQQPIQHAQPAQQPQQTSNIPAYLRKMRGEL
ncbi:MAG: cell division protein FtsZ [Firmicutes bacterium]|nr:cell division protein FtsZ [Bacillota bacterium]